MALRWVRLWGERVSLDARLVTSLEELCKINNLHVQV